MGFASTRSLTAAHSPATWSIDASSSATSTRSIEGTAPSQPALLPVPSPITMALLGCGWRSAPSRPPITCVGASPRALPSILPLTTIARPSVSSSATLLSTPSRSQTMPRRASWRNRRASLGEARILRSTRPAPIGLWRHAPVGPLAARQASEAAASAGAVAWPIQRRGRGSQGASPAVAADGATRDASRSAASPSATRSAAAARQHPVAESSGRSTNPPASDPAMAPAVLHAAAAPICAPTPRRPAPSSAMSSGYCAPAANAAGSTTIAVTANHPGRYPLRRAPPSGRSPRARSARRSPSANGAATPSASKRHVSAKPRRLAGRPSPKRA